MFLVHVPNRSVSSANEISLKCIPSIVSGCFSVCNLNFVLQNSAGMTIVNRYGESGHPCRMPDLCVCYCETPSLCLTTNLNSSCMSASPSYTQECLIFPLVVAFCLDPLYQKLFPNPTISTINCPLFFLPCRVILLPKRWREL
jgi:hypothetical protein